MKQRHFFLPALLGLGGLCAVLAAPSCSQTVTVLNCTADASSCGGGSSSSSSSGPIPTCDPSTSAVDEICDGIDNNCNGAVDEGCPCTSGDVQRCYRGTPVTRSVGLCHDGTQHCVNGAWDLCAGDVLPAPDVCDQRDNDCDGVVDDGCACTPGQQQPCYGSAAETLAHPPCKVGTQTCGAGAVWGECVGQVLPTFEILDGIDNDCNGIVDDGEVCPLGVQQACYGGPASTKNIGVCKGGVRTCDVGGWSACVGEVVPSAEVCNTLDDDCNGMIDDGVTGLGAPCTTGQLGPCASGTTTCGNFGIVCSQTVLATVETCNGIDDDCNGQVDDGPFCCPDGLKNGTETDVDCGGPCPIKCTLGKACLTATDCQSGACTGGLCH